MHLHYILFVLCSIAPLLTHHPTIHHCTELSQGMAFFSGCGRGGSGGSWGIVTLCVGGTLRSAFPSVHPPAACHTTPTHQKTSPLLRDHASISRVGGNPLQNFISTFYPLTPMIITAALILY